MDGVLMVESSGAQRVAEIKTHSVKNFKKLTKDGVATAFPKHYAQIQGYMHLGGYDEAHYIAICKNDDSIYEEVVKADPAMGESLERKACRITQAATPPPGDYNPSWWECRLCDYSGPCGGTPWPVEKNCRTCKHATPDNGVWYCEKNCKMLSPGDQRDCGGDGGDCYEVMRVFLRCAN